MKALTRIAALLASIALATPTFAQNNWVTPGGSNADGKVEMCLNSSGQAVAITSGQCQGMLPIAATPAATNLIGNVGVLPPAGATPSNGSATGTTAATNTTLPAVSGHTQYVCRISIRANATAAATGNATLSDGTKTLNFTQWTAPLASNIGVIEEDFNPCIPASATNTPWTLTSAAPGSGGTVSVSITGFSL